MAQAYSNGINVTDKTGKPTPKMPEPYYFLWGSAAMGFAGLAAMANERLGVLMAWGFLLGALIYQYQNAQKAAAAAQAQANPSTLALTNPSIPSLIQSNPVSAYGRGN